MQALAEAELSELRSSLVTREDQLEAVKQAAARQGVTDQRQALALNEAIGQAEQVGGGWGSPLGRQYMHSTCTVHAQYMHSVPMQHCI